MWSLAQPLLLHTPLMLHPNVLILIFLSYFPFQAQSIPEARKYFFRGLVMPFQVNNIDVTVAANAVYGLTASVLTGLLPASVLDPAKDPLIAVRPLTIAVCAIAQVVITRKAPGAIYHGRFRFGLLLVIHVTSVEG